MSKQSNDLPHDSESEHGGCCSDCDGDYQEEPDYEDGYCCSGCEREKWEEERTYDCTWCKDGEDTTAPCIHNADLREEYAMVNALGMQEYAAALATAREQIEANPHGYGPFKEAMINAYAECNLLYGTNFGTAWYDALEKYDVIHQYRDWCWYKGSKASKTC